jgi:hypothetical protein
MRAKPDLVPDRDLDGEPMYLDERPASAVGLPGHRDEIIWRCARENCGRFFQGTVGYRFLPESANRGTHTSAPRCEREGAFLVVQRTLGSYVCPVAGCMTVQAWEVSDEPVIANASAQHQVEPFCGLRIGVPAGGGPDHS